MRILSLRRGSITASTQARLSLNKIIKVGGNSTDLYYLLCVRGLRRLLWIFGLCGIVIRGIALRTVSGIKSALISGVISLICAVVESVILWIVTVIISVVVLVISLAVSACGIIASVIGWSIAVSAVCHASDGLVA